MTRLNFSREAFLKKKRDALIKVNSFRESFKKRETGVKAESGEAARIIKKLGEKFKWWNSLP